MSATLPAIDVPGEILARPREGAELVEIEQALIEPARLNEDEKAALWLFAWCTAERDRSSIQASR